MKILKKILIVIAVIIVLLLIIALIAPKDYSAEREININAPSEMVFDYVKYLKNQDNFSVWASLDPEMKKEFRGTDASVGFVSAWESEDKNVGSGEQEIVNIIEGERIDYELRFFEPFENTSQAYLITEPLNGASTKVKWGIVGSFAYPMNVFLLVMNMDDMLGADLETGLQNLKVLLEAEVVKTEAEEQTMEMEVVD